MKKKIETITAQTSVANIAHHIPSTPNIIGNNNTNIIWNISARKNEIIAEITPLLSDVKNPEE